MNREEAMRHHPAGKGIAHTQDRIQALIDAAQDEQALELANRERADLESWGMAPMRRLNEKHHAVSTARWGWLADLVVPTVIALFVFAVVWGAGLLGALFVGWPA